MIRAEREYWMALAEWERLRPGQFQEPGINNPLAWLNPATVQSRQAAAERIISTTRDAMAATEWRIFNRYCTGK
jgi:hypothetical protein